MRRHDVTSLSGIRKSCRIDPETECWLWLGARSDGYGQVIDPASGRAVPVHRLTFALAGRVVPDGFQLDHLCRVRSCCNPGHLRAVTGRENILAGTSFSAQNAKKAACPRGHAYSGDNLRIRRGFRECRTCDNERARLYREAHRKEIVERARARARAAGSLA